jgi:VanZ family protein
LALVLMGCAIEVAQGTLTSTRQMDVYDALANSVGVAVALVVALAGASRWPYFVEAWLKRNVS